MTWRWPPKRAGSSRIHATLLIADLRARVARLERIASASHKFVTRMSRDVAEQFVNVRRDFTNNALKVRASGLFTVKSLGIEGDQRVVEGVASTPTDRLYRRSDRAPRRHVHAAAALAVAASSGRAGRPGDARRRGPGGD